MRDTFDKDPNAPFNQIEEEFECPECGDEVDREGQYCSNDCWKASML